MQSTVDAFLSRLPGAKRLNEPIFETASGTIEVNVSPNGDIQCVMENGAQLLIRKGQGDELWFYTTTSVRMDGCFETCPSYQEAVDKFLAINGLA